jgi:hypothetical protein
MIKKAPHPYSLDKNPISRALQSKLTIGKIHRAEYEDENVYQVGAISITGLKLVVQAITLSIMAYISYVMRT